MNTKANIIFIRKVFGDGYLTGRGKDIQVVCPVCKNLKGPDYSKQKLSISLEPHKYFLTNCWVCSYKSRNLFHLIKKYHPEYLNEYKENFLSSRQINDIRKEEIKRIVTLPRDFVLLVTMPAGDAYANRARNYLKARKISLKSDMWYWKFGLSKERNVYNRILVPSFDESGNLNYYSARAMVDNMRQKYFNPESEREEIIFNEINIDWTKELTIVEGVFDLIKANQNSTCLLGSDLSSNYKLFDKITQYKTPILLALDPEARNKQNIIAERLYEFDIPVRVLELRKKDVGSMEKNEFIDYLHNARMFNMDYKLRSKIASIV